MYIKDIYTQHGLGKSQRHISQMLGISRNTVKSYIDLLQKSEQTVKQVLALNAEQLVSFINTYKPQSTPLQDARHKHLAEQFSIIDKELKKPGVTLYILWQEYCNTSTTHYCYQQYCYHYKKYLKRVNTSLRLEHKLGDTLMVDYSGSKMSYTNKSTGEIIDCEVLVCILPYSGYTFAYASHTQNQYDFIEAINQCMKYIGGVPKQMLSDNLRTVVRKSDRYEPSFTDLCVQMARHYQMDLSATRVAKPTDKGKVENAVLQTYRQVFAPLRNNNYYSITELNAAIKQQLVVLNTKAYQGKTYSRQDLFEEEKPYLNTLPNRFFEAYKNKQAKVQRNYHVEVEKQYFSVPYTYVSSDVKVFYNNHEVEVYDKSNNRIAYHKREPKLYSYHTNVAHRPVNHQAYLETRGWNANYFLEKAKPYGTSTVDFLHKILSSKIYEEHTYLSCMGFFRVIGGYPTLRVEAACKRALLTSKTSYRVIEEILKKGLDQESNLQNETPLIITHNNLRHNNYN